MASLSLSLPLLRASTHQQHQIAAAARFVVCRRTVTTGVASSMSSPSAPPSSATSGTEGFARDPEELRRMNRTGEESIYKLGKHRSNAMELVHQVPVTEVDGIMAICDGGGGALGHPLEYISLARPGSIEYCKYCSLRYTSKKMH